MKIATVRLGCLTGGIFTALANLRQSRLDVGTVVWSTAVGDVAVARYRYK